MTKQEPLLKIRFDGPAVGPGMIPVSHLLRFLNNLSKVFQRTGRVLMGEIGSVRKGPQPRCIKDEVALDLVLLTHASPAAVLGFERRQADVSFPAMDMGMDILEKAMAGLCTIQGEGGTMPAGYDTGVLMAWRDAGVLFSQGINQIQFTLNHRNQPAVINYTPTGFSQIQKRIQGPQTNIRTIEGRLLMADFKEHGTRCRVHPSVGEPVLCLFDEEQKDEVLEDILNYVRIVGEAREDPLTGKIVSIKIHDIERMEDKEHDGTELLPQGTPILRGFWESPTLEELALAQNVKPIRNVKTLFGTWPGETNDGFEAIIDELRRQSTAEGSLS